MRCLLTSIALLAVAGVALGAEPVRRAIEVAPEPDLVPIQSLDPTIKIELRYATSRNIAGRPLYPPKMPALVRPHVARQLVKAQAILRARGYGLKIWDAYRPQSAHEQLWHLSPNTDYLADPAVGGSLHTCGVAVDATLVDHRGREVEMPTDFDVFTPDAMLYYNGRDAKVRRNLRILQHAMAKAGFYGMRTEWWHFVTKQWQGYPAIPEVVIIPRERNAAPPLKPPRNAPQSSADRRADRRRSEAR